MKVNVEIKLVKIVPETPIATVKKSVEVFDPKAFWTPIFQSVKTSSIYKIETTLTIDQLRNIQGIENAATVHASVEVADIPCPPADLVEKFVEKHGLIGKDGSAEKQEVTGVMLVEREAKNVERFASSWGPAEKLGPGYGL